MDTSFFSLILFSINKFSKRLLQVEECFYYILLLKILSSRNLSTRSLMSLTVLTVNLFDSYLAQLVSIAAGRIPLWPLYKPILTCHLGFCVRLLHQGYHGKVYNFHTSYLLKGCSATLENDANFLVFINRPFTNFQNYALCKYANEIIQMTEPLPEQYCRAAFVCKRSAL